MISWDIHLDITIEPAALGSGNDYLSIARILCHDFRRLSYRNVLSVGNDGRFFDSKLNSLGISKFGIQTHCTTPVCVPGCVARMTQVDSLVKCMLIIVARLADSGSCVVSRVGRTRYVFLYTSQDIYTGPSHQTTSHPERQRFPVIHTYAHTPGP